jgi:hypothetical protein
MLLWVACCQLSVANSGAKSLYDQLPSLAAKRRTEQLGILKTNLKLQQFQELRCLKF